ncbi:hypothetical protein GC089_03270 [Cellulomonas sp. JZ18]|uniref:hypothetical protein n=1 Tax=Cellulomonas sp. JZ18 TaxID=2654191 RepID=UPI0012D4BAF3|nr:hypothetical protein [Cellulomonas sp. JZ18]QGQ18455.1 hypothetical protein GC089_03270 [Cellulomonas sp. JZ18]
MEITLSRGSVCMGDDVDDHRRTVDVDPDRTIGSVLADALEDYPLASVSGEVSWVAEVHLGDHERDEHGTRRSPVHHGLALLHVPYPTGEATVTPLSGYFLRTRVGELARRTRGGQVALHFRYLSDGQRHTREQFVALYR